MFANSIILDVDGYKPSQYLQYPDGTENVFHYISSRGGKYPWTQLFGLQMWLMRFAANPVTKDQILFAKNFLAKYGTPFNYDGWMYILENHDGYAPLLIKAVPEGTLVPVGYPLVTVESTDSKCAWLNGSYIETSILRGVWYPTTVGTISFSIKRVIKKWLEETGDVASLDYKLHDFGARGVSSEESAGIGGAAHLVNFKGSDTISGILALMMYYDTKELAGTSIPASEHTTMTALGREGELTQFKRMVDTFGGKYPIFACVSDGFDIYNAVSNLWGSSLRDSVINCGSTLVVRPDSGDPATVCIKVLQLLDEKFGHSINDKGFKVLHPSVRMIQGDGVNELSINTILTKFAAHGYSADNIAFGMGGGLLQQLDRDTQKFAMKCSAMKINGEWVDVFKDPVTDPGKSSLKGRVETDIVDDDFKIITGKGTLMRKVYENGDLYNVEDLETIRARANSYL